MTRSLIDQQLVRELQRLRGEAGPLGLNLPEGARSDWPSVPIWGYREPMSTEEAERRAVDAQFWERLKAATLVLKQSAEGRWVLVGYEPVAIADQDPEQWGDQA
jgi:hypothetical protein